MISDNYFSTPLLKSLILSLSHILMVIDFCCRVTERIESRRATFSGFYSWFTSHSDISSRQLATAKVKVVRSTESEAVLQLKPGEDVAVGSHAVLLHRTLLKTAFNLTVISCLDATVAGMSKFKQLRSCDLSNSSLTTWVMIENTMQNNAHGNSKSFQYNVTVSCDGQYLLHESDDLSQTIFPLSDSVALLLELLNHLGLYYHYRALQCPGSASNNSILNHNLAVSLLISTIL